MAKTITLTFSKKTDEVTLLTEGFAGKGCVEAAEPFIQALGASVECSVPTEEFFYEIPEIEDVVVSR